MFYSVDVRIRRPMCFCSIRSPKYETIYLVILMPFDAFQSRTHKHGGEKVSGAYM